MKKSSAQSDNSLSFDELAQSCLAGRKSHEIRVQFEVKYLSHLEDFILGRNISHRKNDVRPGRLGVVDDTVCGEVENSVRHKVEFFELFLGCLISFEYICSLLFEKI